MKFYQQILPSTVAITSTAIALLLTLWLEPFVLRTIGAFFYIAIIVTAWYGGWRSGSLAAVFSTLAFHYFFIPPRYQFGFEQSQDGFELGLFFLVTLMINLLTLHFRDRRHGGFATAEGENSSSPVPHSLFPVPYFLDSKQSAQQRSEFLQIAPLAAQMGMWNWNITTGKIQWSPDHELLFGLTPETFGGDYNSFLVCLHPDDKDSVNQALQQAIQNNSLYQQEFRVVWADGSIHWIEARGHAFYNEARQPIQMTGTATIIDERKQAQGLLEQQFEQQRLVMQMTQRIRQSLNLHDILQTTVDEVRQFLKCDRVIIFQFAPNWSGTVVVESVGSDWIAILSTEIYDPCFGENYVEPYKQGLVTVKSDIYNAGIDPCHLQLLAKFQVRANLVVPIIKGDELWGLLIAHHCAAPRQWQSSEIDLLRQLAVQVSIAIQQSELFEQVQTELAQRQQAEAALQAREAMLRLFIQYAPAGIAMFDEDMCYVMASQRWIDAYNLGSIESLIHRSHYEIFPEIPERWRQIHQRCLAGAIEKCEEDLFVRLDGTEQWESWEIRPWYTSTDEMGGIIIFSVDITERKQATMALQQLNAELEQRVQERTVELTEVNTRLLETLTALEQSEERRRLALDLTHLGFWDLHIPSKRLIWNDNHFTLLGLAPDEFAPSYELWRSRVHPDDIGWVESQFLESIENHTDCAAEYRVVHPDGSVHWVMARGKAICDESGQPVRSLGVVLEISDRKRAEQMLELQAVITRNMAEGICLVRADNGVIVYANPKFEQMFGYDSGELNDQHISIVNYASHEGTAQEVNLAIRTAVLQNGEATYEIHNVKKDGTPFWCRATTSVFQHPDYGDVLVAVHQDITDSKRAEEELRQSEAKFRSLSEASPLGIFMTDIQGQCIYTNPRSQTICGYTFDQALADGWMQFIHPEDREETVAKWSKAVSQRQEVSGEIRYVHKDGTIRFCRVRLAPIDSVADELIGYVGTIEDVTERRAIEQMKSEFISIVSHELRTPLASIRGSLGLLAAGVFKDKPESAQQMLNIAAHDTERLVRLVGDILDLDRLESHKVRLNQQWCDATKLLQQSMETVQSLAAESNITLSVEASSIQVWVDSDRIIQTLVNLVSNAIKFSPPETTVTLSVQDQADRVLFQVQDQGRGIPADKLETIFGRFQQVDASDSRQKGGTGLGLAICKNIVQQHGGQIWVESVVGEGSRFYFTVPKFLD